MSIYIHCAGNILRLSLNCAGFRNYEHFSLLCFWTTLAAVYTALPFCFQVWSNVAAPPSVTCACQPHHPWGDIHNTQGTPLSCRFSLKIKIHFSVAMKLWLRLSSLRCICWADLCLVLGEFFRIGFFIIYSEKENIRFETQEKSWFLRTVLPLGNSKIVAHLICGRDGRFIMFNASSQYSIKAIARRPGSNSPQTLPRKALCISRHWGKYPLGGPKGDATNSDPSGTPTHATTSTRKEYMLVVSPSALLGMLMF